MKTMLDIMVRSGNKMKNFLKVGVGVSVVLGLVLIPWMLVWALNTLFALTIPYTFKTYLAGLVLLLFVNTGGYSGSSKKG